MKHYRLSQRADEDLAALFEYGCLNFGLQRADSYLISLRKRFELLALYPELGRPEQSLPPLRRLDYKSHVVFYRPEEWGVLIVRILRAEMDVLKCLR